MALISIAVWDHADANEVIRKIPTESTGTYGCDYTENLF